ncbi:TetR family transcriptional regulator [Tundrisphaera lichenicola]|uniref:TetR family transcriptional regulator n=1 Tax=Tundrisphaera lichenicola TaxID=2029860 RepID=UPI003EBCAED7
MHSLSLRREPQQLRGLRRIEQILDAADSLFVEIGFDAATTNAIAVRAETSIGSLYQFFPNKDAILKALAERHLAKMRAVNTALLSPEVAAMPFPQGLHLAIDTLADYHAANPGFRLLFCGAMTTGQLARSADDLHEEVAQGAAGVLRTSLPGLEPNQAKLVAKVVVETVRAMMGLAATCDPSLRPEVLDQAKTLLVRYLQPWSSTPPE